MDTWTITEPDIFVMPADVYHGDPAPTPSLSAGLAHTLIDRSPAHAKAASVRLSGDEQEGGDPTSEMDMGTALHAAILENRDIVAICEFPDWRTKAAQEARKHAREMGKVPMLAHRWAGAQHAIQAIKMQLEAHTAAPLLTAKDGKPEQSMFWTESTSAGTIWCRSRVDWLSNDGRILCDLKCTGASAEPGAWGKRMWPEGMALRAAHYLRGARALGLPVERYLFVVCETDAPYGVSVIECSPELLAMGEEQAAEARETWARCLRDDDWPAYPLRVATVDAPSWASYAHEERKMRRGVEVDSRVVLGIAR